MFGLGIGEIAVILFIALIVIGPKKLPELARGLGKGMREFQNAARGLSDNLRNPIDEAKNEVNQIMDQPADTVSKSTVSENGQVREDLNPKENYYKQDVEDHGEEFVSIDDIKNGPDALNVHDNSHIEPEAFVEAANGERIQELNGELAPKIKEKKKV